MMPIGPIGPPHCSFFAKLEMSTIRNESQAHVYTLQSFSLTYHTRSKYEQLPQMPHRLKARLRIDLCMGTCLWSKLASRVHAKTLCFCALKMGEFAEIEKYSALMVASCICISVGLHILSSIGNSFQGNLCNMYISLKCFASFGCASEVVSLGCQRLSLEKLALPLVFRLQT